MGLSIVENLLSENDIPFTKHYSDAGKNETNKKTEIVPG